MAFGVVATPSIVDPHVVADSPAQLLQPLMESCEARLSFSIIGDGIHEYADPPHPRLLRPCREWPRGRSAAEQRDEVAPPHHSITGSACASTDGGRSSPSAFAVVRLMVRSNLVGCSTGMSAGLTPRRTLSINSALRRNVSGKFVP